MPGVLHGLPILIIEDDVDTCENLRDILELDDHRVVLSHSGESALSSPFLPEAAVILLDWKLPDVTAPQLLPQLLKRSPDADTVVITGHGDFSKAISVLREGAADYLLKPINPEVLRSSLQRIAQRRQLARERNRVDAMFRNLVLAAPCVILILRQDLTVDYISPFAEQLTGYQLKDVRGQGFVSLFLPNRNQPEIVPTIDSIFAQDQPVSPGSEIVCRQGERRWISWNTRRIELLDGAQGILAVGIDVTQARLATEKLVQAERLAAIGEAMTGLAHESRNALQRSQAFLELLAAEVSGQAEPLRLVDRIQEAQATLHQLYEEVRQYAAPLRPDRHLVHVGELVEETWGLLEQLRGGRGAKLIVDETARNCAADVDRFLLQQVFRNILENSLAACSDPVEIRVQAMYFDLEGERYLRLSLTDNGPGLNPDQRARIFDPFYTTKTRGTGLGMTLCRRIVEAHGGKISIGPGPGAEIVICLPVGTSAGSARPSSLL